MLTKDEARALVVAELERPPKDLYPDHPTDLVVLDDCTIEREWGWVFFYTSDRFLKTGDFSYGLAGNAPYIVNRDTGELLTTGTANPIDYYIAEYERKLAAR
jgi:immunity protein 35 of polymorphic toxin system